MSDTPFADLVAAVNRLESESFAFAPTDIDAEVSSRAEDLVKAIGSTDPRLVDEFIRTLNAQ